MGRSRPWHGDSVSCTSTGPDGAVTTFEHDPVGRVSKVIRGEEVEWSSATDTGADSAMLDRPHAPGVVAEEVDVHQSAYSARWQELSYSPPELDTAHPGTYVTQYSYDQDRRLTGVSAGGVLQSTITYDATGRQTEVETPDARVAIEYEQVLQERHVVRPATISRFTPAAALNPESTLSLGYDGQVPLASTAGGETEGAVAFEIDEQLRPTVIRVADEPDIVLAYNDDSDLVNAGGLQIFPAIHARRTETRLGVGAVVLTTGTNLTELGDIELREALCPNCGSEELLRIANAHDAAGRITTALESVAGAGLAPTSLTRTFEYDALGRLTSERRGAVESTWTYDENGNRTERDVPGVATYATTYDAQDRLTEDSGRDYEHNDAGQRTRTTALTGEITDYAYDLRGNLRHVALPDGGEIVYTVDGRGRRIGRRVLDANDDLVSDTTWLYKDQLDPIAERDNLTGVVSVFVYASSRYTPDAMIRGGATYRFVTDHLGSVRLVLDAATGAVVQRIDYDAWGNITLDTAPEFQPFGFAGGLHDRATGFVRFGARDYDPATGRWTAKDPIRWGGGDSNLFAYVRNDPVNFFDPTGRNPVAGAAVGAEIGAFAGPIGAAAGAVAGAIAAAIAGDAIADWYIERQRERARQRPKTPAPCDEPKTKTGERGPSPPPPTPPGSEPPRKDWEHCRGLYEICIDNQVEWVPCADCLGICKREGEWPFGKCGFGDGNIPVWREQ